MTWQDIKAAIEAQGVTNATVIYSISIEEGKPVLVVIDPQHPGALVVKDTY
jgi:hypothetical protein